MFKKLLLVFVLLAELHLAVYATLMAFLLNVWMEDDSFAMTASEFDWWISAAKRLGISSVLSLLVSLLIYYIGTLLSARRLLHWQNFPIRSALLVFFAMMIAGLTGAVMFLIKKPFI